MAAQVRKRRDIFSIPSPIYLPAAFLMVWIPATGILHHHHSLQTDSPSIIMIRNTPRTENTDSISVQKQRLPRIQQQPRSPPCRQSTCHRRLERKHSFLEDDKWTLPDTVSSIRRYPILSPDPQRGSDGALSAAAEKRRRLDYASSVAISVMDEKGAEPSSLAVGPLELQQAAHIDTASSTPPRIALRDIHNSLKSLDGRQHVDDNIVNALVRRNQSPTVGVLDSLVLGAFEKTDRARRAILKSSVAPSAESILLPTHDAARHHWVLYRWLAADGSLELYDSFSSPSPSTTNALTTRVCDFLAWLLASSSFPHSRVVTRTTPPVRH